jgi:peptidoglycan/LPS O-acetylase OafA/YrhL
MHNRGSMNFSSPAFAAIAFTFAVALGAVGARIDPPPPGKNRSIPIDGLRGLLAFAVFVHHSVIWHYYAAGEGWHTPASALYAHFGDSAVIVFFMVTAFLFSTKILDSTDARPVAWRDLYIGRFFRIMPLYALVVVALVVVVFVRTGLTLTVSWATLLKSIALWLAVTMFGAPPINGLGVTPYAVAAVTWTLRYEVVYYCALGFIALAMRRKVSVPVLCLTGAALTISAYALGAPRLSLMTAFAIGTAAGYVSRIRAWREFANQRVADLIVILSVCIPVGLNVHGVASVFLFGIAFALICSGTNLFGLLESRAIRYLGEISFSIYLIHGLVLFVCFECVVGVQRTADLSPLQHWAIVLACVPVVIGLAGICYHVIERPGIEPGRAFARRMRSSSRALPIAG